jgi:hypothetical protein
VNEIETVIRYDGPSLAGHEMDVEELAPALLALASLIQAANHKFNGDRSSVRVVVNADIEQQCFQIKIKLIQDLLQKAKSFLDGDLATIKDICEWIGIIGAPAISLFKLIVALGRKQQDSVTFKVDASDDATVLQIQNLHLHLPDGTPTQVRDLLSDGAIVGKAKEVMRPVTLPGYESVSFRDPSVPDQTSFEAKKDDAEAALSFTPPEGPDADATEEEHTPVKARVLVKTQRNEGRAQWELKWAARAEWASIDDVEWLERFQRGEVPHTIPFYLDVEMEMITSRTNPDAPARFHVMKVRDVVSSTNGTQGSLFNGSGRPGEGEE